MKAVGPFETSRSDYPLTQRHIPERNTQPRCCGNLNLAQRCGVPGKERFHSVPSSEGSNRHSPRTPGFDPRPIPVRFVVVKLAMGRVFVRALRFSPSVSLHKVPTLILQHNDKRVKPGNLPMKMVLLRISGSKKKKTPHFVSFQIFNTLRTGLLNCLNARSRGLTFRHRASCI